MMIRLGYGGMGEIWVADSACVGLRWIWQINAFVLPLDKPRTFLSETNVKPTYELFGLPTAAESVL